MLVVPSWLDEVIWFTPEMRPNCRSSGVATAEAIVCGSAPGNCAPTLITGKSTRGSDATGNKLKARIPESSSAAASRDVPIGRRINGDEILMLSSCHSEPGAKPGEEPALIRRASSCGIGLPILYFSNLCASRSNHK